jgi:post-segregation antitoxin (ccd killing protein)
MQDVTVTITEEQRQYATDNHLNLSSLLREAIDERRDG